MEDFINSNRKIKNKFNVLDKPFKLVFKIGSVVLSGVSFVLKKK